MVVGQVSVNRCIFCFPSAPWTVSEVRHCLDSLGLLTNYSRSFMPTRTCSSLKASFTNHIHNCKPLTGSCAFGIQVHREYATSVLRPKGVKTEVQFYLCCKALVLPKLDFQIPVFAMAGLGSSSVDRKCQGGTSKL